MLAKKKARQRVGAGLSGLLPTTAILFGSQHWHAQSPTDAIVELPLTRRACRIVDGAGGSLGRLLALSLGEPPDGKWPPDNGGAFDLVALADFVAA
jgi:hypothetical protein